MSCCLRSAERSPIIRPPYSTIESMIETMTMPSAESKASFVPMREEIAESMSMTQVIWQSQHGTHSDKNNASIMQRVKEYCANIGQ